MMRNLMISLSVATLAVACQKGPAQADPPAEDAAEKAVEKAAEKPAEAKEAALYAVKILPGDVQAGQEGTSVIEVTPTPGYKVNLEFPTRLKLNPVEGITHAKAELGKGDAEISEKVLRFNVAFTPAEAGKYALEGIADFSVCNERTCRLIRGEKLSWEVAVK